MKLPRLFQRFAPRAGLSIETGGSVPAADGFIPQDAVTALTARQAQSVVWACVNALAIAVARSKWRIVDPAGLELTRPTLLRPLTATIDGYLPATYRWRMVVENLGYRGNAYLRIHRTGRQIEALEPAHNGQVQRRGVRGTTRVYLLTMLSGERVELQQRDVVAIHGPGFNGLQSPSPIQAAGKAVISLDQDARKQLSGSVKAGLAGRGVILMSDHLLNAGKETRDQLASSLEEGYANARNAGRVPVLPPGYTPGQMGGVSPADLQLIELLRWNTEDICRIFGVPPRVVFHYAQRLRVSGFEGQAVDWQRQSVEPWCDLIADTVTASLLGPGPARYMLDSSLLSLGTFSEQVDAITKAIAGGLMTPNEGRMRMGIPEHEDGDRLILPAGTPGQAPGDTTTETNE